MESEGFMSRAVWNGVVLAESEETRTASGYTYFPPEGVHHEYLRRSDTHSSCSWKGTANYFDVVVGGEVNTDAAWTYPKTLEAGKHIEGWFGFWHGIVVEP
jgi:uncharacterized protein (DUF427 family)